MTLFQDNISPYISFVEGSAPSSPAASDFRLFFDSSDHLLKWKNSAGTVTTIATGTPLTDPMTTRGDIIVRNASNATARLGIGSSGKVLSSDGTDISWQTPAGGSGALVLLEQHTASSSAQLDFTTCITSTYDEYVFIATNLVPATDNVQCFLKVSTDGGSSFVAGSTYTYAEDEMASDASSLSVASSNGTSSILLAGGRIGIGTGTGKALSFKLELSDPLNASLWKSFRWRGSFVRTGGTTSIFPDGFGQWQTATAVNAIRFVMSSGNITSGTIRAYGVAKT